MKVQRHFSPLNCTFLHCISKKYVRNKAYNNFFNEIKDLGATLKALMRQNLFYIKHLAHVVKVMLEGQAFFENDPLQDVAR